MREYRIEQVKVDDESLREIQQLLQLVFEDRSDKFSFDYLKWLYSENPVGNIVGFNAYSGNVLAAHYVTMPIYMMIDCKKTLGVLSLNTATHPEHRGKRLFSILAERTFRYAAENGYEFVIGLANANSTHGFIKNLKFRLVGPLTFKVGVGKVVYPHKDFTYRRYWDKELIDWRLKNPSSGYYKNGDIIVSKIKSGFKLIVYHDERNLVELCKLKRRPFNLYIGNGADLKRGIYCGLPWFIKHSPFNLIFRDLTDNTLPIITNDNVLLELIDFDVV